MIITLLERSLYILESMIVIIYHFSSLSCLHVRTVRCVLVIAYGNFRLERLYVYSLWCRYVAFDINIV